MKSLSIVIGLLVSCSANEATPANRAIVFAHMMAPDVKCEPIDTGWGFIQDSAYCPLYGDKGALAAIEWCRAGGWNPPSCIDVMPHAPPKTGKP